MEFKTNEIFRSKTKKNQKRLSAGKTEEEIQKKQDEKSNTTSLLKDKVEILINNKKLLVKLEEELDDVAVSYMSRKLEQELLEEKNKSAPARPITSSQKKDEKKFRTLEESTIQKVQEWANNKKNKEPFELYLNLHLGDIEPQHWVAGKIVFEKNNDGNVCRITTISLDSCGSVSEENERVKSAKNLLQNISESIFPDITTNFKQGIEKRLQGFGTNSCGYYMVDLKYKAIRSQNLMLNGTFKTEVQRLENGYLDSNIEKANLFSKLGNASSNFFKTNKIDILNTSYNDEGHKDAPFENSHDILQEKINIRRQVAEKLPNLNKEEKTKFIESSKIPESVEQDELKYYPRSATQPNQETCEMNCSIVYDEKDKDIKYIQMCGNNEPINKPFRIKMKKGESASDIILQIQKEGLSPFKDKITILRAEEGPNVSDLQIKQIINHIDSLRKENAHQTVQKI